MDTFAARTNTDIYYQWHRIGWITWYIYILHNRIIIALTDILTQTKVNG